MPISDLLAGRLGPAGRLPGRIEEMRGPARGVVMVPLHLSWPGLRECDVSDEATRRSMYGMLLSQGKRNDIVRFINADLLAADWTLIAESLEPKLRRWCERQFALVDDPAAEQLAAEEPTLTDETDETDETDQATRAGQAGEAGQAKASKMSRGGAVA